MAPGGEMFRYPQQFGENVLPRGSHEWLPYSVDAVRAEIVKHQFIVPSRGDFQIPANSFSLGARSVCSQVLPSTPKWPREAVSA